MNVQDMQPGKRNEPLAGWQPDHAEYLAAQDGIRLRKPHWVVIHSLRAFYQEYQVSPFLSMMVRYLCRQNPDGAWNRNQLKDLFPPDGISRACRYGGVPSPIRHSCP